MADGFTYIYIYIYVDIYVCVFFFFTLFLLSRLFNKVYIPHLHTLRLISSSRVRIDSFIRYIYADLFVMTVADRQLDSGTIYDVLIIT